MERRLVERAGPRRPAARPRAPACRPRAWAGISIDTRTLEPGELFFAIKGDNSDGHDYVGAAFARGAAAAVVDEVHADALKHARLALCRP